MKYSEEELLPLSGLQHLVFCERQAALIHVEAAWADNTLTVEGSYRHKRVHDSAPRRERRGDLIITRGLLLRSFELGLSGIADVVEFHLAADEEQQTQDGSYTSISLPGISGLWVPLPVEYKRGRPKAHRADEVQLCAQALCLEEMTGVHVHSGALFYGKAQRRVNVACDLELRALTQNAARRFHELFEKGETPAAVKEKRCQSCSLADLCVPEAMNRRRSAKRFVAAEVNRALRSTLTGS